jgi:hypothetical protein
MILCAANPTITYVSRDGHVREIPESLSRRTSKDAQ